MKKERFELAFDEPPALVFIQRNHNTKPEIYQDGEEVKGVRSIVIRAGSQELTTHEIDYVTGLTKG